MERISIIIPCFNEQEAIPIYYEEMKKIMADMKGVGFELIFVDDGSGDHTLEQMRSLAEKDARCRYLSFSRNFGKEAALYAGLSHASGDYIVVMDADLQDPPELLPRMYELLSREECDCVAARRADRDGEPPLRSFLSDCFYKVMGKLSNTEIVKGARDYRMMKRKMVDAVLSMSEYNRFSKGIFQWIGFQTIWLEFPNTKRCAGETKWSMKKLIAYSLEGITGFSAAPLSLAFALGAIFCGLSLFLGMLALGGNLFSGKPVTGWTFLACILLLSGGVQLLCIGILGQYLSKIYLETKRRPIYILKESSQERRLERQRLLCTAKQVKTLPNNIAG